MKRPFLFLSIFVLLLAGCTQQDEEINGGTDKKMTANEWTVTTESQNVFYGGTLSGYEVKSGQDTIDGATRNWCSIYHYWQSTNVRPLIASMSYILTLNSATFMTALKGSYRALLTNVNNETIVSKIEIVAYNGDTLISQISKTVSIGDSAYYDFVLPIMAKITRVVLKSHIEIQSSPFRQQFEWDISRLTGYYSLTGSQMCGKIIDKDGAGRVVQFADTDGAETPLQYCNSHGVIKSRALVIPGSALATSRQIKVNPLGVFAQALLGSNNDGILSLAKYMSALALNLTLKSNFSTYTEDVSTGCSSSEVLYAISSDPIHAVLSWNTDAQVRSVSLVNGLVHIYAEDTILFNCNRETLTFTQNGQELVYGGSTYTGSDESSNIKFAADLPSIVITYTDGETDTYSIQQTDTVCIYPFHKTSGSISTVYSHESQYSKVV